MKHGEVRAEVVDFGWKILFSLGIKKGLAGFVQGKSVFRNGQGIKKSQ
jgi:hypothetical protein